MSASRPSGSLSALMERCLAPWLLLLLSTSAAALHGEPLTGAEHDLRCFSDYLHTINCSLRIEPSESAADENASYWIDILWRARKKTFACMLTNSSGLFSCSMKTCDVSADPQCKYRTFKDFNSFEISLCQNSSIGLETCKVLVEKYMPVKNIKPNPPCCLTVSHNASQHHFAWESTYEEYITGLTQKLQYQLDYYTRGPNVLSHSINRIQKKYDLDDENLKPDTEYSARVRSSPNGDVCEGTWSDWSPEVHWKTDAGEKGVKDVIEDPFMPGLAKVLIILGVLVVLVSLLCYVPIKKWRRRSFIPTPAPYFHTLYSDCQGDFKSWVVTAEKTADVLKTEETLQIDMLTKCEDVQELEGQHQPQLQQQTREGGGDYRNISDPGCDVFLPGVPYANSTMTPTSGCRSSLRSCSSHPTEGDSGCWLSSHTSLEKEPPIYCNQYCTLSAFQQAELQARSCPTVGALIVEEALMVEEAIEA